jgi:RNA polymerase sigma-70 factor, ECF subfamily
VGVTGDEDFDAFYAAGYARVVRQVYLLVDDLGEAEDVAQDAFVRALARWRTVRTLEDPVGWTCRVAVNHAISRWRRGRNAATAWRRRAEPETYAAPGAERVAIVHALRALPARQRAVLVLHHLSDLPVADVARELGVPEGTVKSDLSRGRARLALTLADTEEVR